MARQTEALTARIRSLVVGRITAHDHRVKLLKSWILIGLAAVTFIWVLYYLGKRLNIRVPSLTA
jgi:hypothetical protein